MLIQHLNHLVVNASPEDEDVQFKLENSFQLLTLCLTSKKFTKQIHGVKDTFMDGIKQLLENSYTIKSVYSPRVMAKSMLTTVIVILELFPVRLQTTQTHRFCRILSEFWTILCLCRKWSNC